MCVSNEHLKNSDPEKYELFKANHGPDCMINHKGSAPAMEVSRTKSILERSIAKSGLCYTEFLGDGDTKSFAAVENTYHGIQVKKLECIGGVQKRIGNWLQKLKKDVKGLGGRGKWTDATIDNLQNYYGIAIRRNTGNLEGMKKGIHASLFHVASSANNSYHTHCPSAANSWCLYQRDKATVVIINKVLGCL